MGKVIQFPKNYQKNYEQDIVRLYKDYYSDQGNYKLDPEEYKEGIDYCIVEGRIVNLW